jgi:ABC-type transporter Mla subunit MlaD
LENSLSEAMERLKKQAELLDEPAEELRSLQSKLEREAERFLQSVARAAGGRPLKFSWGSLGCIIRKGSNGASCDCRIEEGEEEIEELASDLSLDLESATRVYILSHREEIIEACAQALEEQRHTLRDSIDHIRSILDNDREDPETPNDPGIPG